MTTLNEQIAAREFIIELKLQVKVFAEDARQFPVPEGEISCAAEILANSYSDGRYAPSSEIMRHGAEQLVRAAIKEAGFCFLTDEAEKRAGHYLRGTDLETRNRRVARLQDCHVASEHVITARLLKEEIDDGVDQAFDNLDALKPFFESE